MRNQKHSHPFRIGKRKELLKKRKQPRLQERLFFLEAMVVRVSLFSSRLPKLFIDVSFCSKELQESLGRRSQHQRSMMLIFLVRLSAPTAHRRRFHHLGLLHGWALFLRLPPLGQVALSYQNSSVIRYLYFMRFRITCNFMLTILYHKSQWFALTD